MFKRIYFFFFTYMAAMYFSGTLLILWLSKNGFNFSDLIAYYFCTFAVALIAILYLPKKNMSARQAIFWGIILNLGYILVLIKIWSPAQLLLSAILSGLNVVYFWIPYNIMYFKYSSMENRGLNSGIYFLITPVIGITLQPLAGFITGKFGFEIMFSIGIFLYLVPIFLIKFLPDFKWNLDVKKELKSLGFNWTIFFQGISSRFNYSLIPIFTLFFINKPGQFGSFFGYLSLVAAVASIINGYVSDKVRNRKYFFYFFSSLAVLSFVPLAFVHDSYSWVVFTGISSLCIYLANPFWFTFNLDYYKDIGVEKTMVLREVFLNSGYIFNLLVVFLVFQFTSSTKISLMIIAFLCCLLPVVSYLQGIYRDKMN